MSALKESLPKLIERLEARERCCTDQKLLEQIANIATLWRREMILTDPPIMGVRAFLEETRLATKALIRDPISILTIKVNNEEALILGEIVRDYLQVLKTERQEEQAGAWTEWGAAKILLGKKSAIVLDIEAEVDEKLKLLPLLKEAIVTYPQRKAEQEAQAGAAEEKEQEQSIADMERQVERLQHQRNDDLWQLEEKAIKVQQEIAASLGSISNQQTTIEFLERGLSLASQIGISLGSPEKELRSEKKKVGRDEDAQHKRLQKINQEFRQRHTEITQEYSTRIETLLMKPVQIYQTTLRSIGAEVRRAVRNVDFNFDFKLIDGKMEKLKRELDTLRAKPNVYSPVLPVVDQLINQLASLKEERKQAQHSLQVKNQKRTFATKWIGLLGAYLKERASTYKIIDFFSKVFAFLFGCLGWKTEKSKREQYVNTTLFEKLNAFADETATAAEVNDVIQAGVTSFRPRADTSKSLYCRLFQAQKDLQAVSPEALSGPQP